MTKKSSRNTNIFALDVPPGQINGNLRTAPVVALFLNPGFEDEDEQVFEKEDCRILLFEQIIGESDFPLWFNRWRKWFLQRVKLDGMTDEKIGKNVSIFNVCSYASRDAKRLKPSILNSLPSSQAAFYIPLAVNNFEIIKNSIWFSLLPVAVGVLYLVLAKTYWFKIPFMGVLISLACFVISAWIINT
ncbi:hypothetical protein [Pseudoalteromonas xiamenensis]|uniref:Uncharacterized protein n=1 Tax=Pseudoalteromonas xiamenensis TaxID=882626 RepID=A0A975DKV0_9GAMM|nr:hypothetical protein [Pseudoalteromonas xiamenensis]QTH72980.1 hypothetical protein J5O05_17630 [Pseudoalteromonas xiamenensis]